MKRFKSTYISCAFLFTVGLFATSCNKEYLNPNAATAEEVLVSQKGLTGVTVGLQKSYSTTRPGLLYAGITLNGLTTNEMISINTGNTNEERLVAGGVQVDGDNTIVGNVWTSANKIIYDADNVIKNAAALPDKNYAAGLIAHASIFKALALGNLSQYWEKIPADIGKNVQFITRLEGFNKAISTLDNALSVIAANPISTTFTGNVPTGLDIPNTLNALKARYALFAGNYSMALAAANAVDLTKKSVFNYDALNLNPVFEISTSTNNVIQPKNLSFGQVGANMPDVGDGRVSFYTVVNTTVRIKGFGDGTFAQIPVYLPGEMMLIKAEAYARQATPDLTNSLVELNKVVTKNNDVFAVNANLAAIVGPKTQPELLDLIYKHRCIELFMSGLKLEDMHRFNRPDAEMKRRFMPYPNQERDNNPNTPANPTF
jgi:hypothetical protein